ncbi:MAG: hypothetical protein H6819_00740 [Phycisphaerales bacterium]|nr:hypothetical protein [Phycisphaerales bacterium]MCB9857265.1 hypothetical protein [Phycisphaerales bacterium]MCB9863021.1 hypothetical protein [Phycisphaerales bacterium]
MSTSRTSMALLVAIELVVAMPATAVTFDVADGDTDGLITAILQSNGNIYADTINLAAGGTYTLTAGYVNAGGASGLPSITSAITINGNGALLQRDPAAASDFRMLRVSLSGNLTLNDLTIANGQSNGNGGGAFWVDGGQLTMSRCTLVNNSALNADGGAISSKNGRLTLTNCTMSGNHADLNGGAVYCRDVGGRVTLSAVTVSDNSAGGAGGGLCLDNNSTLNISDSILANSANGDCAMLSGVLNDLGHNLVEDGSCLADPTSFAADPMLGPLQDNGGSTLTHALPANSPAVDAIPVPDCAAATDQRGHARPRGAGCDIGAFEADPPPGISIDSVAGVESSGALQFNLTLSFAADDDVLVDYQTFDGSATLADSDYESSSGTITFTPGSTTAMLSVAVNDDALEEADESLGVRLSNPAGAVLAVDTAVGTILNDDAAPAPECRTGEVFDAGLACNVTVSPDDLLANNLLVDARCAPVTLQLTPAGPFDVGTHSVTLTATDGCGQANSCDATFTVQGGPVLSLTCGTNWTTAADAGQCRATVGDDSHDAVATLPCSPLDVLVVNDVTGGSTLAGAEFPMGVSVVTWTLSLEEGDVDSCEQTVEVMDTEPPAFDCPEGPVLAANLTDSLAPDVLDNCDVAPFVECSPAFLGDVPPADDDVEVICVATDESGNTSTCTYVLRRSVAFDLDTAFLDLRSAVDELRGGGALSPLDARVLKRLLNKSQRRFQSGHTTAGCNKLMAFNDRVNSLINSGTLTEPKADPLREGVKLIYNNVCLDPGDSDNSGGDETDSGDVGGETPSTGGEDGNTDSGGGNDNGGDDGAGEMPPVVPDKQCGTTGVTALGVLSLMLVPLRPSRRRRQLGRVCGSEMNSYGGPCDTIPTRPPASRHASSRCTRQ